MRHICLAIGLIALGTLTEGAFAQQSCPTDQGRLGEGQPCVPARLQNYLYCLTQSGGGRIEIRSRDATEANKQFEIALGGKGSGVIITGEGAGAWKSSDTNRVIKELDQKLDASLAANCRALADPKGAEPRVKLRPAEPTAPVTAATGDPLIDKVARNLATLQSAKDGVSESKIAETIAPLFNRQAFYGIREEDWNHFLFALCATRLIVESNIEYFRSYPRTREELGKAVQIMAQLQREVASLYGPNFSATDHVRRYIGNRDAFINKLPPRLREPDLDYYEKRDVQIKEIRDILKPIGFTSF